MPKTRRLTCLGHLILIARRRAVVMWWCGSSFVSHVVNRRLAHLHAR